MRKSKLAIRSKLWLSLVAAWIGLLAAATAWAGMVPVHLRCEYRVNPVGIDATRPRLTWQLEASERDQWQSACRILVASNKKSLEQEIGDLWDSGRVASDETVNVTYAGKPLVSGQECFWKVCAWDKNGKERWSDLASWSMGLLQSSDWQGKWIGLDQGEGAKEDRAGFGEAQWIWVAEGNPAANAPLAARYFRRSFELPSSKSIHEAGIVIAADNEFRLWVNGKEVGHGNDFHSPQRYAVGKLLKSGGNVIAIEAHNTGEAPNPAALIARLNITFADGGVFKLDTDRSWKTAMNSSPGWDGVEFDESAWAQVMMLGTYGAPPWGKAVKDNGRQLPARYLRREFTVEKAVHRATAYVSGQGLCELYLNGEKVSDDVLSPGLTDYDKRSLYVAYDVTDRLKRGDNAIGVILGNGRFFAPRLTTPTPTRTYGFPKLQLQLNVEYADGTMTHVYSDEYWRLTTNGPIRANNEYDGVEYDARMELPGWCKAEFNDSSWQAAQIVQPAAPVLSAQMCEPIRVMETLRPLAVTNPKPGMYIFDMGQNMVGWCRMNVQGPRGTQVRLRHAETLLPDGTLYTANLRGAKATASYTLKGQGVEVYEPRFTYFGFRYVEVIGFPGKPTLESIEGCVVHDALPRAGEFSCSNPLLNQIYHNIYWGTRGNYRSIPTDCPQRDERQGWLGDRSAESVGESYLFDISGMYTKWLADMRDGARPNGSIPDVAPAYWPFYNDGVVWPSSYIILPNMLHERYGDSRILAEHYEGMKKWVDYMTGFMADGIIAKNRYGDWCVPPESLTEIHSSNPKHKTSGTLLSTAYFYYDLRLMARSARLLGKPDDAKRFEVLADQVKTAFNRRFYDSVAGCYDNGTQTSCVLPLAFGLVPDEHKPAVFAQLVDKITSETHGHVGTGLVGGQYLMRVLSDNGRADLAYKIASQKTYPSWGYMIGKGATTIWELWNGDTADPAMNSGNHVMLVGDLNIWLHEYLGGIRPASESCSFKKFIIAPEMVPGLAGAKASYNSIRGVISSEWSQSPGKCELKVSIPANTTATVRLPTEKIEEITEDDLVLSKVSGVKSVRTEGIYTLIELGSGDYRFVQSHVSLTGAERR